MAINTKTPVEQSVELITAVLEWMKSDYADEDIVVAVANKVEEVLDDLDENDAMGTEGWRHTLGME